MKPTTTLSLFVALISTLAQGETFVGPTTSTNRLLVSSNSAIIITATFGDFTNSTQVALGGGDPLLQDYFAPLQSGSQYAVAGPAELIFSNAVVISYYVLTNSTIFSQFIGNDPIGIPIATNNTMQLFNVPGSVFARFSNSGSSSAGFVIEPNQPAAFTGPGTLWLNSGVFPPYGKFISYFIAQNGFTIPNQRAIVGPSGSFAITVEKSFDLNTWVPILLANTSDPNYAFYRLRLQR